MIEVRPPKEDDQEMTHKAYLMVLNFMGEHPEIEPTLWAGALMSCIVTGYKKSGFTYQEFVEEVEPFLKHYHSWWDDDN